MQRLDLKCFSGIDSRNNGGKRMPKTTTSIIANWEKQSGEMKINYERIL
jgi:hypothetical protein